MNDLCVDSGYRSLLKYGEELCGDSVQEIRGENTFLLVLADGLGSGVKANILSTLTSKILATMVENDMSVEECVATIAATLPVCQKRGVAYSTFTIIHITNNDEAEIIQYDNPMVIMLRDGKSYDYPTIMKTVEGKKIYETKIKVKQDDVFIAMSDGAIYAGVEQVLNYGWQRENIVDFAEANYDYRNTAKIITSMILEQCALLYNDKPGDDTTVATVQVRKRKPANLMIGPPKDPNDVKKMMASFFAKEGRHIVCGGTTSTLAAEYLGKPLITDIDYIDPDIPPTAKIEGVDLVTEGVLTISRVLEYATNYLENNERYQEWSVKKDGASQIARLLFREATDINFYVGRAMNPAHQNPNLPINFNIKMRIVERLAEALKQMGKTINVCYF
ncbi:MAG TPA: SpoIIE family protein phosphatase [Candidatus Avimonoglobus intestinipullorum]|uniref:SpoIIE family protein phosphatase n=1 Tax=Candidatus Avimonoglobus intestinipullorum TaxID=2840699 RepID=A0A9D1LUQ0_9FIRM|nr:SpoIIE family protein phosphatase [Candidatus Avimonoglobus intestinipullorum]